MRVLRSECQFKEIGQRVGQRSSCMSGGGPGVETRDWCCEAPCWKETRDDSRCFRGIWRYGEPMGDEAVASRVTEQVLKHSSPAQGGDQRGDQRGDARGDERRDECLPGKQITNGLPVLSANMQLNMLPVCWSNAWQTHCLFPK